MSSREVVKLTPPPLPSTREPPQDVLAATHCLRMGFPDVFDDVEVLALYIGALGHDAGHFRLNNAFLKNSKHTLFLSLIHI